MGLVGACAESPTEAARPHTLAAPASVAAEGATSAPKWNKTVLPLPSGTKVARAHAISDSGTVVGVAFDDILFGPSRPFRWNAGVGVRKLPVGTSASDGSALAVSDGGRWAAGWIKLGSGTEAVRWNLSTTPVTLSILPRCSFAGPAEARGVNDSGVVVGRVAGNVAVRWSSATSCPSVVAAITDTLATANAINDFGSIAGPARYPSRSYLLSRCFAGACFSIIRPLAGHTTVVATDVNDANVVVGRSSSASVHRAFTWTLGGGIVSLGDVATSLAPVVSDMGRIVWGSSFGTARTKLGATTDSLPVFPYGVNKCGDIVGYENRRAVRYKKITCD